MFVCVIIWRLGLVVTVLLIVLDGVICMHIARRYVCIGLCVLIGRLYLVVVWLGLICVCLFVWVVFYFVVVLFVVCVVVLAKLLLLVLY